MRTSLRASIKGFFIQILPTQSRRILRFLGFSNLLIESPGPQSFNKKLNHLYLLVQDHKLSSKRVISALNDLTHSYPLPPVELVSSDIWPNDGPSVRVKTHLRSTLSDAIKFLESTRRTVSVEDEKYLKLLLTHPCGCPRPKIVHQFMTSP